MTLVSSALTLIFARPIATPIIEKRAVIRIDVSTSHPTLLADGSVEAKLPGKPDRVLMRPPYFRIEEQIKINGKIARPIRGGELAVENRGPAGTTSVEFFDSQKRFLERVDLPFPANVQIDTRSSIALSGEDHLYWKGQWIKLPKVPGAVSVYNTGDLHDGTVVWATCDIGPDVWKQSGTARFAIFEPATGWVVPPFPKGFSQSYARGLSDTGYALVTLDTESAGNDIGYVLYGEIMLPEETSYVHGYARFYKDGRWFGQNPPRLKLKPDYRGMPAPQVPYPVQKWRNFEVYRIMHFSGKGGYQRDVLRFRINGKWFFLHELVKGARKTDFEDFTFVALKNDTILLQEAGYDEKPKRLVVLQIHRGPEFR